MSYLRGLRLGLARRRREGERARHLRDGRRWRSEKLLHLCRRVGCSKDNGVSPSRSLRGTGEQRLSLTSWSLRTDGWGCQYAGSRDRLGLVDSWLFIFLRLGKDRAALKLSTIGSQLSCREQLGRLVDEDSKRFARPDSLPEALLLSSGVVLLVVEQRLPKPLLRRTGQVVDRRDQLLPKGGRELQKRIKTTNTEELRNTHR